MIRKAYIVLFLAVCISCNFAKGQVIDSKTNFFPSAGFFQDSINLELSHDNAEIYYSLDGSTPSKRAIKYTKPILINKTTVVRTASYYKSKLLNVNTQTYFIKEPQSNIMVVSLAISPGVLFNKRYGLFMPGLRPDSSNWKLPKANFWKKTEAICNSEFFETDGEEVINQLSGFRIFGGMSRIFPQKSIALSARDRYGQKKFDYPVFGKKEPKKFKFLVLRNSGSDWGKSQFRDALITSLVSKWDLDVQAARPAHVYINGKYWGIYNIREKINRFYLSSHHGLKKDSISLMEHKMNLKFGSSLSYFTMLRYIKNHNFQSDRALAQLNTMMDVENFMNYQIAEIYADNQDAGGNIKYWRPAHKQGRWRWILFDTDFGFGLHNPDAYRMNTLNIQTDPKGYSWPNPPWSTYILRKLLANKSFKQKFITQFCDHLNDSFSPEKVTQQIDKFYAVLKPEIPRHQKRWNLEIALWEEQVLIMKDFAAQRPFFMRMFLSDMFQLGKEKLLHIEQDLGGSITINNTIHAKERVFEGKYFESIPITMEAKASFGYLFDHWEGLGINSKESILKINLSLPTTNIRAVFKPFKNEFENKLVINEISNANNKSGDWIELYNASEKRISLKDWILRDEKHEFILPEYYLAAGDYVVVCQDINRFRKVFHKTYNVIGSFDFGLSKTKETIQLYSSDHSLVDESYYQLTQGDSLSCMALLLPQLDNSNIDNWVITAGKGSPGKMNPFLVRSMTVPEDNFWLKFAALFGFIFSLFIGIYWLYITRRSQN